MNLASKKNSPCEARPCQFPKPGGHPYPRPWVLLAEFSGGWEKVNTCGVETTNGTGGEAIALISGGEATSVIKGNDATTLINGRVVPACTIGIDAEALTTDRDVTVLITGRETALITGGETIQLPRGTIKFPIISAFLGRPLLFLAWSLLPLAFMAIFCKGLWVYVSSSFLLLDVGMYILQAYVMDLYIYIWVYGCWLSGEFVNSL